MTTPSPAPIKSREEIRDNIWLEFSNRAAVPSTLIISQHLIGNRRRFFNLRRLVNIQELDTNPMDHPGTHSIDADVSQGAVACLSGVPAAPPRQLHSAALPNPIFCRAFTSALGNWPIKLGLATLETPYLARQTLLIAADCAPFAMPRFHEKMMEGRSLLVGCPKLEDGQACLSRLVGILRSNEVKAVEVAYMNAPCCWKLVKMVEEAIQASGKRIPLARKEITVQEGTC